MNLDTPSPYVTTVHEKSTQERNVHDNVYESNPCGRGPYVTMCTSHHDNTYGSNSYKTGDLYMGEACTFQCVQCAENVNPPPSKKFPEKTVTNRTTSHQ